MKIVISKSDWEHMRITKIAQVSNPALTEDQSINYYVYDMAAREGINDNCILYGIIEKDIEGARNLARQRGGGVIYSIVYRFNGQRLGDVKKEEVINIGQ